MTHHLDKVIEKHLQVRGESLTSLAAKAGISRGYLTALRNGVNPSTGGPAEVSVETMRKLAGAMGMSLEKLLYLAGFTDSESEEVTLGDLPADYRRALEEMGVDYIAVTKDAYESGLTADNLRELVEYVKNLRAQK